MTNDDGTAAAGGPITPTRGARVGWGLTSVVCLGLTLWLLAQFVGTTWGAAVLLVRGEVLPATVTEVELHRKVGMADDLVVAVGPPIAGVASITTYREDIPIGALVDVLVDPQDPSRAALAEDGWPWRGTVVPLLLALMLAVVTLLTLGGTLGVAPPPEDGENEGDRDGPDAPSSSGAAARS